VFVASKAVTGMK